MRRTICVFDSGVGGLSVLNELTKLMPNEDFVYLGDNDNAPYGNKRFDELLSLGVKNLCLLNEYNPKAVVIACNTLSANVLTQIKEISSVPVFGVFPPIESAVISAEKTLVLCTKATQKAFKRYDGALDVVGLPYLVSDIEQNIFRPQKIDLKKHLSGIKTDYDCVILGCTHYFFVQKALFNHFLPLKMTSGNHFCSQKVFTYLKNRNLLEKNKQNSVSFIGSNGVKNQKIYEFYFQKTKIF